MRKKEDEVVSLRSDWPGVSERDAAGQGSFDSEARGSSARRNDGGWNKEGTACGGATLRFLSGGRGVGVLSWRPFNVGKASSTRNFPGGETNPRVFHRPKGVCSLQPTPSPFSPSLFRVSVVVFFSCLHPPPRPQPCRLPLRF